MISFGKILPKEATTNTSAFISLSFSIGRGSLDEVIERTGLRPFDSRAFKTYVEKLDEPKKTKEIGLFMLRFFFFRWKVLNIFGLVDKKNAVQVINFMLENL